MENSKINTHADQQQIDKEREEAKKLKEEFQSKQKELNVLNDDLFYLNQ